MTWLCPEEERYEYLLKTFALLVNKLLTVHLGGQFYFTNRALVCWEKLPAWRSCGISKTAYIALLPSKTSNHKN